MSASPTVQAALAQSTLRQPEARASILAAIAECARAGEGEGDRESLLALLRVEEHFQALLRRSKGEVLKPEVAGADARDFVLDVRRIHVDAANGMQRFLRRCDAWVSEADRDELVPRAIGVAIQLIHGYATWGLILGDGEEPWPFRSLHALYLFAEGEGCERTEFAPYPGHSGARTTVQASYLRSLLLQRLGTGLTKAQVDAADGLLARWCPAYALRTGEPSESRHGVDLASDAGIVSLEGQAESQSLRHLDAAALRGQLDALRALQGGPGAALAEGLEGLTGDAATGLVAQLDRLQEGLAPTPRKRGEERAVFKDQSVEVAIGLPDVVAQLRHSRGGAVARRVWSVHDLSSTAYGLVTRADDADGVHVGELVGLRNQETGGWIVGTVVRKVEHDEGRALVGIEVLGFHPLAVGLGKPGDDEGSGLYLLGGDPRGALDSLVVRSVDVAASPPRLLSMGLDHYRIRMNQRVRKGAGWDQVRFGIESRS